MLAHRPAPIELIDQAAISHCSDDGISGPDVPVHCQFTWFGPRVALHSHQRELTVGSSCLVSWNLEGASKMLMQSHRSGLRSGLRSSPTRAITGRIVSRHTAVYPTAPHRGAAIPQAAERSFSAPGRCHGSLGDRECESPSTLLPWADPYIASLQRRHEGELRRNAH
jgi:hypothetical protein